MDETPLPERIVAVDPEHLDPEQRRALKAQRRAAREARLKAIRQRRAEVHMMHCSGSSFATIAKHFGICRTRAYQLFEREDEIVRQESDRSREQRMRKHEARQELRVASMMGRILKTDTDPMAVAALSQAVTAIEKRQASMFGLNAPTKVAQTKADGSDVVIPSMAAELLAQLSDADLEAFIRVGRTKLVAGAVVPQLTAGPVPDGELAGDVKDAVEVEREES